MRDSQKRIAINSNNGKKQQSIQFDDFGWEVFQKIQNKLIETIGMKLSKAQVFCFLVKYYMEHEGLKNDKK
jgi:hypothetical protein|tara:strand:- start:1457 stop:1669 length:213 start_codon:yes stop_codon:yes gene_type:complete